MRDILDIKEKVLPELSSIDVLMLSMKQ